MQGMSAMGESRKEESGGEDNMCGNAIKGAVMLLENFL